MQLSAVRGWLQAVLLYTPTAQPTDLARLIRSERSDLTKGSSLLSLNRYVSRSTPSATINVWILPLVPSCDIASVIVETVNTVRAAAVALG